ncbi:hypothetical protein [Fructilactobacillus carniphilus]|uniref:TIGR04197 family type VII secretion effector n=1 Tax=Fructilactobacillus carniphilus TaxID=2940297 RepID=A0ABY5BZ27_9LACO|nr:hypothetical protein [Fructilactobacillus carniphilus]USS90295.1 hypothetical protein M3M37_05480 [Fructilactobacillus carniphilus]
MVKISSDSGIVQEAVSGLQHFNPINVNKSNASYSNIAGLLAGNNSVRKLAKATNSMEKLLQDKAMTFTKVDTKKHGDDASLAQGFK